MSGEVAALSAALLWTLASGLWRSLSCHATAVQLNGLKNGLATLLFLPVLLGVPWREQPMAVAALFVSGAIGIALGDSLYLAALRRIGTRRTLTLEATGPVLASLGSPLIQGDPLTVTDFAGALLVAAAVLMIARSGSPDQTAGVSNRAGFLLAFGAVLSGLVGAFVARSVLIDGAFTPLDSAAIRLLGGTVALLPIWCRHLPIQGLQAIGLKTRIITATVLGTNLGILLQQQVFKTLPVGPGVTLMSTAPLMAVAIARWRGQPLQPIDWTAAVLGVSGVALTSL